MRKHKDLITRLSAIANSYETAGCGWWENQGIGLDSEPDWPAESIMVVSWPDHVSTPRYNGDCTISGPYCDLKTAIGCAADDCEIDPYLQ